MCVCVWIHNYIYHTLKRIGQLSNAYCVKKPPKSPRICEPSGQGRATTAHVNYSIVQANKHTFIFRRWWTDQGRVGAQNIDRTEVRLHSSLSDQSPGHSRERLIRDLCAWAMSMCAFLERAYYEGWLPVLLMFCGWGLRMWPAPCMYGYLFVAALGLGASAWINNTGHATWQTNEFLLASS